MEYFAAIVREGSQNRNVTEVMTAPAGLGIVLQIIEATGHPPLVKIVSRAETNAETSQVERPLRADSGYRPP
jgi:hypothetical protein